MSPARKKIVWIITVFAVIAVALHLFTSRYTIGIAHQECLPERVWLIDKSRKPSRKGEYVSFRARNIPRFKDATPLTKIIAGVSGDTIIVNPSSGQQEVTLNGMPRLMQIKAEVILVSGNTLRCFIAYQSGSDGRALPFIYDYGTYVIPEGHLFVAGAHPGSYDSRYWGVIKKEDIIGAARPIL